MEGNFVSFYVQHASGIFILYGSYGYRSKMKVINPFWKIEADVLFIVFMFSQRERNTQLSQNWSIQWGRFKQKNIFSPLNILYFHGYRWHKSLIGFREPKNRLSMWNNNTAEVYKALTLLADKMVCWYTPSNCFSCDPCHHFSPLLVPGCLHTYGESVLEKGWMAFLLKATLELTFECMKQFVQWPDIV